VRHGKDMAPLSHHKMCEFATPVLGTLASSG
jgi:hypothetical protein